VYDVVIVTRNEVFPHNVSVALFAPIDEEGHPLLGSYFMFTRVFVNDFDIGDSGDPPKLIFWVKHVSSRILYRRRILDETSSHNSWNLFHQSYLNPLWAFFGQWVRLLRA